MPDLTERIALTVDAVQLGWAVHQQESATAYGYEDRRLTVWWSDDDAAVVAELSTSTSTLLARREWLGEAGTVADWVRDILRTWRIEFLGGVTA